MKLNVAEAQVALTKPEAATLALLRDAGPQKLSMLNDDAVDCCFKRRPKLVFIHTNHPTNPMMDITRDGLIVLAAWERQNGD